MTEGNIKKWLGVFLVSVHFLILLLVILFWLLGGFLTEEMTTTIAIIAPFFAAYTAAVIRYVISTKYQTASLERPVSGVFVVFAFGIPAMFAIVVAGSVALKAFNLGITSFENFKIMLATAETVFGVYAAQMIFSLFDRGDEESGITK